MDVKANYSWYYYVEKGFYVGPNWFIYGRGGEKIIASDVEGKIEGQIFRGWRTRQEAQAVADELNAARRA